MLPTAALNGTENRLSYGSTATTNSNPRLGETQITQSAVTAYIDPGLRHSKAFARADAASADYWDGDLNEPEYPDSTRVSSSGTRQPAHRMPRMPFDEPKTSRPVVTAYAGHEEQHPNKPEPKKLKSRVRELNGHELDYGKTRNRDSGASQLESNSITPRHSLRHKTSSPSLRKPS